MLYYGLCSAKTQNWPSTTKRNVAMVNKSHSQRCVSFFKINKIYNIYYKLPNDMLHCAVDNRSQILATIKIKNATFKMYLYKD